MKRSDGLRPNSEFNSELGKLESLERSTSFQSAPRAQELGWLLASAVGPSIATGFERLDVVGRGIGGVAA